MNIPISYFDKNSTHLGCLAYARDLPSKDRKITLSRMLNEVSSILGCNYSYVQTILEGKDPDDNVAFFQFRNGVFRPKNNIIVLRSKLTKNQESDTLDMQLVNNVDAFCSWNIRTGLTRRVQEYITGLDVVGVNKNGK